MRISLKQSEIEAAVQQYIIKQGISLVNKDVKIDFTAGRKEGGLTAEVDIDENDLPVLRITQYMYSAPPKLELAPVATPEPAEPEEVPEPEPQAKPEPEPLPKAGVSLFGG